ncbi:nuclear transport factor 2 family protein [bacterium]|nr:nuclear transport factor 2 family protein [bacterium]
MVQHLYSAFTKRDINTIVGLLSPDVEWGEPANPFNPAAGIRHGHQGFLEWLNIGRQTEDILVLEPRKMPADHDSAAVVGYMKCLVISTGKTYESDFVHMVTIKSRHGNKISKVL